MSENRTGATAKRPGCSLGRAHAGCWAIWAGEASRRLSDGVVGRAGVWKPVGGASWRELGKPVL